MADSEDRFLSRWSRRKQAGQDAPASDRRTDQKEPLKGDPPPKEAETGHGVAAPAEAEGDPEVVARLPDLDSLDDSSDFSVFLEDGVPEVLRRKALRKLWRLNPVLANLDGLNDYDEDFTVVEVLAENIKTLYKAGRGYLDQDEAEEDAGGEAEVESAESASGGGPEQAESPGPSEDEGRPTADSAGPEAGSSDAPGTEDVATVEGGGHGAEPGDGFEPDAPAAVDGSGSTSQTFETERKTARRSARDRRWGRLDS